MTEFMYESLANLMTNFRLIRTDRFDVFLIKHDVGRTNRKVKDALLRCGHPVENAQKQPPLLPSLGWFLMGWKILDKNRNVLDATAKFFRQRILGFFCNPDEFFALHRSPTTEIRGLIESRLPCS